MILFGIELAYSMRFGINCSDGERDERGLDTPEK